MESTTPRPVEGRGPPAKRAPRPVKLWSWPKVIFYFPLMVASFICAIGSTVWPDRAVTWGTIFFIVFLINTVIMGFDFPRTSSLNLVLFIMVVLLGGFLINQQVYTFWDGLQDLAARVRPEANNQFYWLFGGIFAVVFLIVWLIDFRFNYWLIFPNEIIHRHGFLGSVDRYPAPGLEMKSEITDVFEYAMLRSGRLIIQPTKGPAIVLDTVMNIDRKQVQIQRLLDALSVEIVPGEVHRQGGEPSPR
ncbi:MAG: hypothetical protein M3464_08610 [Chloroflexota bacterium]|nr:hypothetical protein [Chloroflexota bacterium]